MEEQAFSAQESLQTIQTMIDRAKNTVADRSYYFLLWGWIVLVACIGQFILKVVVKTEWHPIVWTLCFLGVVLSIVHSVREGRNATVKTYVQECLDYLWSAVVISYVLFGFAFASIGWQNCYTFYILLYALGSYVTGRLIKFPPLVWGAVGCWMLAVLTYFSSFEYNILICALAILISYIIPGHLLRNKYRKSKADV
jgi:hypothetical protein